MVMSTRQDLDGVLLWHMQQVAQVETVLALNIGLTPAKPIVAHQWVKPVEAIIKRTITLS